MASNLQAHFQIQQIIRDFFVKRGFIDVLTPPAVKNPGMEVHIHPFKLTSAFQNKSHDLYLHTSPEFHMKELLSKGLDKIFTLSYCFRDEPDSPIHRNQFIMLEWYRANCHYETIMQEMWELYQYAGKKLQTEKLHQVKYQKATIQELFLEYMNLDILNFLDASELKKVLEKDHKDIPLPESVCAFDDYFFLAFLNKIEPQLKHYPYLMVYEYPAPLAALSTLKDGDPRVAERFEVYAYGIELCNAFNELTNLDKQIKRFEEQAIEKKTLYGYELPQPNVLYESLKRGMPKSAGIAVGVERLLQVLTGMENPFYK